MTIWRSVQNPTRTPQRHLLQSNELGEQLRPLAQPGRLQNFLPVTTFNQQLLSTVIHHDLITDAAGDSKLEARIAPLEGCDERGNCRQESRHRVGY